MLIRSRSIKFRKALCLGPKNNFPTLSLLSVLGGAGEAVSEGGGGGGCGHMYWSVCLFSDFVCSAASIMDAFENIYN